MASREASVERITKETSIKMTLRTDSERGGLTGSSGIGFFDHMLNSFCVHGGFELILDMKGDLEVDGHHTVEDIGIVLGTLLAQIWKKSNGIARFADSYVPMDEALAFCAVDISGRSFLVFDASFQSPAIGNYDTQLTGEFFRALAFNMCATVHMRSIYGTNDHHKTEALFKAFAITLKDALRETGTGVLSAKGVL